MEKAVNVLGFAGSLRQGSYNRALLRAALDLVPAGTSLEIFELNGIPPFNQDMEASPPQVVKDFKARIKAADAILVVTPEYNYSIPGVLKNAIDWASRPYGDNAFDGKPAGLASASIGMLGGARAQYHVRQTMVFLNMFPLNKPEVFVTFAPEKFDKAGKLLDETTKQKMAALLSALACWTRMLSAAGAAPASV